MSFALTKIMAHQPPMLLVDAVLSAGERVGLTVLTVRPECLFVDEQGVLAREALVEFMAQSVAACNAYKDRLQGQESHKGFLVMLKNICFYADARVGNVLQAQVETEDFISNTFLVRGRVLHGENLLAEGELRIFTF